MKLATLQDKFCRDGKLVVVSKDLQTATFVPSIAPTLQYALDNWLYCQPLLQRCYDYLNVGEISDAFAFADYTVAAPLPRAYQWIDGSAYVNHIELVRKARGAKMPEDFWHDPLMYQGGSDTLLGAYDPIALQDPSWGLDFEAEVAIITSDVPLGTHANDASQYILLFTLVNDISLRNLIPKELAKGFGFFHSKPSSAFSPVVVTPDELGNAWDDKKVHLPLYSYLNEQLFGQPNAGIDMTFDFPTLIAHASKTRRLTAGTIIGSGTVSNYDRALGASCIAEKRMLEILNSGKAITPFMQADDNIRIEMLDKTQRSIFGAINQRVVAIHMPEAVA